MAEHGRNHDRLRLKATSDSRTVPHDEDAESQAGDTDGIVRLEPFIDRFSNRNSKSPSTDSSASVQAPAATHATNNDTSELPRRAVLRRVPMIERSATHVSQRRLRGAKMLAPSDTNADPETRSRLLKRRADTDIDISPRKKRNRSDRSSPPRTRASAQHAHQSQPKNHAVQPNEDNDSPPVQPRHSVHVVITNSKPIEKRRKSGRKQGRSGTQRPESQPQTFPEEARPGSVVLKSQNLQAQAKAQSHRSPGNVDGNGPEDIPEDPQQTRVQSKEVEVESESDAEQQPGKTSSLVQKDLEQREVIRVMEEYEDLETYSRNSQLLHNQWAPLCKVYKAVDEIGIQTIQGVPQERPTIATRDDAVDTAIASCDHLIEQLQAVDQSFNYGLALTDVKSRVRDVDYSAEATSGRRFKKRNKAIYFHLYPKLIDLLRHAVDHFLTSATDTNGPINVDRLAFINDTIQIILNLGAHGPAFAHKDEYPNVIQPIKNKILHPLKSIRQVFDWDLAAHAVQIRDEERATLRSQREARDRATARHAERIHHHLRRGRSDWRTLHAERRFVEQGILSHAKRLHLVMPEPRLETDANGDWFERVAVFGPPRIGPPLHLVQAARDLPWTTDELVALEHGLRTFAHADSRVAVYIAIFRTYCRRGQVLSRYNVTEIVTKAAELREFYLEDLASTQREMDQDVGSFRDEDDEEGSVALVEPWVAAIPLWTNVHGVGGENMVSTELDEE